MATADPTLFLRRLTRGMAAETWSELSDRQLVEQFLACRDESVFEAILRRHGPMVCRVCRRVLQQPQDVEDAFQATFLLLAQKLRTIRKRDSLASWLHGVAHRVSLKARHRSTTRRLHEDQARVPEAVIPEEMPWREIRAVLDEELARLPEKWRLPLVVCYLEGLTQDEAAARAGWSKNTLRRRLDEAREVLAQRLKRRAVLAGGALAAVLLSDCASPAAVPAGLAGSIVEAAVRLTAGQALFASLVPAHVAALTEGVFSPMFASKFKITVLVGISALMFGAAGIATRNQYSPAAEPGQDTKSPPPARADKHQPPPATKPAEDFDPRKILAGRWDKTDTKESGPVLLRFNSDRQMEIHWMPPQGPLGPNRKTGGALPVRFHLSEADGQKLLVIQRFQQRDILVPYKLEGDTLTLDGGELVLGGSRGTKSEEKVVLNGTWKHVREDVEPAVRPSKRFSFKARICQGDPLSDVKKIIDGLSGDTVPNSGGWFRIRQENVKEIDGEQIVPGYLMCTNFEPAEGGEIRLRLTLVHTGLEEDSKQETVVRTSYKKYDLTVRDGETVQLRFGKTAPRDVWLQLRVQEDK